MKELQKAFAYVDEHFDDMLEDLKNICGCESTAKNAEGLERARGRILGKMTDIGLVPRLFNVHEGNAFIYASLPGEAGEDTLLFYNHYDVVEAGRRENWITDDPFGAAVIDGKIYARGISDNKGALFSRLHAVQTMLAVNGSMPVGIKFIVDGEEESSSGTLFSFAEEYPDRFKELAESDLCVWENGRNDEEGHPWLRFGVRGSVGFDLYVVTAASDVHGRMGTVIPSASWRLVWALSTLKNMNEEITIDGFYDDILPVTDSDLEVLHSFPYDEERQREKLEISGFLKGATGDDFKRQLYTEPALSICGMEAGEVHNGVRGIVPHKAYARISFYLVANQDPSKIGLLLRKHLDEHGFSDIRIEQHGGASRPVRTPVDIPFRARATKAAAEVYDKQMVVELTQLGSGPASVFRDAWPEMPIVGFGPANVFANHHAPDENMKISDYKRAIKYLVALFYSYCK